MTEEEARERCALLAAEHPDRHTHQWVATKRGDEWVVAKIGVPPSDDRTTAETRADERPPTPGDPQEERPLTGPLRNWFAG